MKQNTRQRKVSRHVNFQEQNLEPPPSTGKLMIQMRFFLSKNIFQLDCDFQKIFVPTEKAVYLDWANKKDLLWSYSLVGIKSSPMVTPYNKP